MPLLDTRPPIDDVAKAAQSFLNNQVKSISSDVGSLLTDALPLEEAAVPAEEVAGIGIAVSDILDIPIILAAIAFFNLVIAFLWLIREAVANIRIVGGPLSHIIDYFILAMAEVVIPLDDFVTDQSKSWWSAIQTVFTLIVTLCGFATVTQLHEAVQTSAKAQGKAIAQTNKSLTSIDNTLKGSVQHLSSESHALWTRLQQLEDLATYQGGEIHKLQSVVAGMQSLLALMGNEILVQTRISNHLKHVTNVQGRTLVHHGHAIKVQHNQIHSLGNKVAFDESQLFPIAEIVGSLSLLLPLVQSGPVGIDNLLRTAEDPCDCLNNPDNSGSDLSDMVMQLWFEHEP